VIVLFAEQRKKLRHAFRTFMFMFDAISLRVNCNNLELISFQQTTINRLVFEYQECSWRLFKLLEVLGSLLTLLDIEKLTTTLQFLKTNYCFDILVCFTLTACYCIFCAYKLRRMSFRLNLCSCYNINLNLKSLMISNFYC